MTLIVCLATNCTINMRRSQSACSRHWKALTPDLRQRIARASRQGGSALGAVKVEAREYLEARMIGEHQITHCDGKDCDADIVWMTGFRQDGSQYPVPVNADTVTADDIDFDRGKHRAHWADCPNAKDFRSRR